MTSKKLTNIGDIAYESSIEEFKKVLSGFDSDFDRINSQTVGLGSFEIGKNISDSLSSSDAKVLNKLIGTISGGYYLRDMINGKALEASAIKDLFKDLFSEEETEKLENQPYYFYHHSSKGRGATNNKIKEVVKQNGLPIGDYNGSVNPADTPNELYPSLGAVEFKRHTLSLAKRYGDALNLFFNCITNVDMSLCAPYLDVKILVPKNDTSKKSLGHEVQFRFIKESTGKDFISKQIKKINPFSEGGAEEEEYDTHGMELFLSPQTLTNSNVRKQDKKILEPNSTLLTLKDCTIAISGLGVGLFCSKTAKISMTLHDRSRLRDIAPLITPTQFAKSRVIIEYGWSHPQGGMTSSNVAGKFLNSLRDKGVFIVKGSSFSFTDGGHVDINVDLAMMGGTDSVVASVGAGDYIQASVFKSKIKDAIEILKKEKSNAKDSKSIIPEKQLKIENAAGAKTYMSRSDYIKIMENIRKGEEESVTKALKDFIVNYDSQQIDVKTVINDKIENLPYVDPTGAIGTDPFLLKGTNASYMLTQGVTIGDQIPTFTSLGSVLMAFVALPIQATHQFDEVQMFFYPMNQSCGGGYIHTTASFPICKEELINIFIGDDQANISTRNDMTVARFMNRIEKKILRNPTYKHYGLNSEYELLNVTNSLTDEMIKNYTSKGESNSAIEAFKAANPLKGETILRDIATDILIAQAAKERLANSLSDKNATEADLRAAREEYTDFVENTKVIESSAQSVKEELLKMIKKNINSKLTQIYASYGNDIVADDPSSFSAENKFCMPNLSYYFETINPHENDVTSFSDIKEQFLRSNNKIVDNKTILRIHVYDEEAIGDKTQELLLNLCNSRKVIDSISESKLEVFENYRNRKEKGLAAKFFGKDKITKTIGDTIVNNLDFDEVKDIIKQTMPSITIGSNLSNVKSFSANSTTSGEISNVLFITEQVNQKKLNKDNSKLPALDNMDDLVVVPAVGSLNCPGMPLIQRGQQFFIDAGTGTSIDAIYTVQSVNHTLSQGGFNTTANLIYSGQNRVESIREMIGKLVGEAKE